MRPDRRPLFLLSACCLALFVSRAGAADRVADGSPGVEARMAAVMASPDAFKDAALAGRKVATFCANCHGDSGVSQRPNIPNLAGQHPVYLLTQIEKFADGRRKDEFMSGLIKVLKPQDRLNLAVYYASQEVPASPARDAALVRQGQQIYTRVCIGCHGPQGRGQKRIARLAGQQGDYLVAALNSYCGGKASRLDPVMGAVVKRLSSADITALAAYLPTMP